MLTKLTFFTPNYLTNLALFSVYFDLTNVKLESWEEVGYDGASVTVRGSKRAVKKFIYTLTRSRTPGLTIEGIKIP